MDLKQYLAQKRDMVEGALEAYFRDSEKGPAARLFSAMKYSLFAGGKRLRPILCMAGAEAVGGDPDDVLPVACALELIHTYSLIHDDLPSMDDDDFRRGVPTNHKVFGEALAVLAGDGLLTEAFRWMSSQEVISSVSIEAALRVINLIATAAGCSGMVAGQAVDIESEGKEADQGLVEFIHRNKTGALISASVRAGAIMGGGDEAAIGAIGVYGDNIGLAFQISDDILDIEGDPGLMGKEVGSDQKRGKITYPGVVGIHESRAIGERLVRDAVEALEPFGKAAQPLREIAWYIIKRKR